MFGWFKKKEPIQTGMDKHTNRYINEHFLHYDKEFDFRTAIECIEQSSGYDDLAYLTDAINNNFHGDSKEYLKRILWDTHYKGRY